MPRRLTVPALALVLLLPLVPWATVARDLPVAETGSADALLEALSRVPDTTATREAPLSYLDQAALVAARPGAAQPASVAEALALVEAQDPAARLWLAAFMGAASGDPDLLRRLGRAGGLARGARLRPSRRGSSPQLRHAAGRWLRPAWRLRSPGRGASVRGAWLQRAPRRVHGMLLCGAAGCEAGMDVNIAAADPSLPFGAEIGRSEPVASSKDAILSSADLATLDGHDRGRRRRGGLAGRGPARIARWPWPADPDVTLTQATFLPGGMLGLGPDIYQLLGASPGGGRERSVTELADSLEPMPAADCRGHPRRCDRDRAGRHHRPGLRRRGRRGDVPPRSCHDV